MAAKNADKPTGPAVALALYETKSPKNQAKARRMIQRAREHGYITEED